MKGADLTKNPEKEMTIIEIGRITGIESALCEYIITTGDPLSKEPAITECKKDWFPLSELEHVPDEGK